jgi:ubiquinone biosynthesis protein
VERFAENFATDASVYVPKVYWETATSRMLTLERIHGIKISDVGGRGWRMCCWKLAGRARA